LSAIAGIYYRDGRPVMHSNLEQMLANLAHRGPDGAGLWSEANVGLGHRMLWTTPESLHERLPLYTQAGDLAITADARLDNRDELLTSLRLTDRPAGEISDSALILAAYQEWGDACPQKLLGDFAFAIWDGRKQHLFCARDHFGVKSFFYYASDTLMVFANEIKALLTLSDVPRRLNETRIADYLTGIFEDQTATFYQGILRLPAAHTLTIDAHSMRLKRYWVLDPTYELRLMVLC